jgi:hypothetical protein
MRIKVKSIIIFFKMAKNTNNVKDKEKQPLHWPAEDRRIPGG